MPHSLCQWASNLFKLYEFDSIWFYMLIKPNSYSYYWNCWASILNINLVLCMCTLQRDILFSTNKSEEKTEVWLICFFSIVKLVFRLVKQKPSHLYRKHIFTVHKRTWSFPQLYSFLYYRKARSVCCRFVVPRLGERITQDSLCHVFQKNCILEKKERAYGYLEKSTTILAEHLNFV